MTELEFSRAVSELGGEAYIVGGWVRDYFIGKQAYDKDYVVCGLTPEALITRFGAQPVGRQFPVFLLKIGGAVCEVALARTERKTGRGYLGFEPDFSADTTIEEDLRRRDTKMNSMALRLPDMQLIDPFGGRQDIERGVISATSEHFRDDPVRTLRAARQAAQLGFSIDKATRRMMTLSRDELAEEPAPRILAEMTKALESPRPRRFFEELRDAAVLEAVLPEAAALVGVEQPAAYHHGLDAFEHTMDVLQQTADATSRVETRFAALAHDLGKGKTPRDQWPHHYEHAQLGLEALDEMNARMSLPRTWLKFARFIVEWHMKLPKARRAGSVVRAVNEISRRGLPPHEIKIIIRADKGEIPPFLERYDETLRFLNAARRRQKIPENLPEAERSQWLVMRFATEYARWEREKSPQTSEP